MLCISIMGSKISKMKSSIYYGTNMLGFLFAGIKDDVSLRKWLMKKGRVWNGPQTDSLTFTKHKDVNERLKSLPEKFGSNNQNGSVERQNNLGFQQLNNEIWPELKDRVIGLGQNQESHCFVREFIDRVLKLNSHSYCAYEKISIIQKHVNYFFKNRDSFNTSDIKIWNTILLHKLHLNLNMTWEEGVEFMDMQKKLLITIALPKLIARSKFFKWIFGLDIAIEKKQIYLEIYKEALKRMFPQDLKDVSKDRLMLLASNFMDSLLFAGGQSVPTVLSYSIVLLKSSWLEENAPGFKLTDDLKDLPAYIMEVIRYFPPVSGFVYVDRSAKKSIYLSLHTAQCDKEAWGPDTHKFRIRDMKDYDTNSLAWADTCLTTDKNYKNNSRVCPAKNLSFMIFYEFLKGYMKNGVDSWKSDKTPSDIKVTSYSISSINLTKK